MLPVHFDCISRFLGFLIHKQMGIYPQHGGSYPQPLSTFSPTSLSFTLDLANLSTGFHTFLLFYPQVFGNLEMLIHSLNGVLFHFIHGLMVVFVDNYPNCPQPVR